MPDINTYLAKIKAAIYGEEVRGSIHDAIAAINSVVDASDQVSLKNALEYDADVSILGNWTSGYFPANSTTTTVDMYNPNTSANYVCQAAPCSEGDIFSYSGQDNSGARAGVFLSSPSSANNVISLVSYSGAYAERRVFAAPVGAHYILSNSRSNVFYQLRKLVSKHQIFAGTDVNDLSIPGAYYCHTSAASQEIDNIPDFAVGKQFMLTVESLRLTNEYYRQTLYITTSASENYAIFTRNYTTQWGDWKEILNDGSHNFLDVEHLVLLEEGDDLDDIIGYGSYYCNNAARAKTLKNVPFFVVSGFSLYVLNSQGPKSGANYVRQIIFANKKVFSSIYTRTRNAEEGGWGPWQLMISSDMYEQPAIMRESAFAVPPRLQTRAKKIIRVGTNNVAHYWLQSSSDVSTRRYLSNYPLKIAKWKRWLLKADLDILFTQECEDYIDIDRRISAFDTLYAPFFDSDTNIDPTIWDGTSDYMPANDIAARRKIFNRLGLDTNSELHIFPTLDPTYGKDGYLNTCTVEISGVGSVLLVNAHNFAGNKQARITDRQNYLNLLAQYIVSEDPDYFIVCGDFNAKVPDYDYPILLAFCNAVGAKPVNGGVLGWFTTCSAEEIEKGYDNIIVSNNIEIKSIECDPILVAIGALHTDHLPVTATLEFH